MTPSDTSERGGRVRQLTRTARPRMTVVFAVVLAAVGGLPVVSAHGGGSYFPGVKQWYALVPLVIGLGIVASAVFVRRSERQVSVNRLLGVTFLGLVIAALGGAALVQLSPVTNLNGASRPFDSRTLTLFRLVFSIAIITGSFIVGRLRWPRRPRYTVFGFLLGAWVGYPAVFASFQPSINPVGYALFAAVIGGVFYIVWRDCRETVTTLASDASARRFGLGVGVLAALFFMLSSGILIVLPDPSGIDLSWTHNTFTIVPVQDPLVYWPSLEFWIPSLPLGGYFSVGMMALVLTLAGLVGLNGAVVAYQWRCRGDVGLDGAAGAAAIAAPNACCCCGPVLSQLAIVGLGPTAAMPIYWLFIDVSSPFGVLFFAGSIALLIGNLIQFSTAFDPAFTSNTEAPTDVVSQ